jgi:hypothetical protein
VTATSQTAPGAGAGFALSPNRLGRYLAAVGGLLALVLFYLPWVTASLPGIGEVSLSGAELARGAAITRVNQAAVDASRNPGAGAGGAPATGAPATGATGGSGGMTLPTRVPTVAAGSAPATGAAPPAAPPAAAPAAPAAAAGATGGLTLPTRVPTVAAGSAPVSGAAQAPPATSGGASGPAPAARPAPPAPDVLPQFALYLVPLAGLGIAAFSLIWERLVDRRDRFAGRLWTLLLAYGGLLLSGYVLYKAATAQPGNVLLGAGAVVGLTPALWGVFLAFLFSAACLTVAWLSPAPPPPDPYWRARAPVAA